MRVAIPTTPANYFHLLRRQALSPKSKPLVVFTPKSLLRHKLVVSPVDDVHRPGTFQPVIPETSTELDPAGVKRVLLCTGKVYYDLVQARADRGITDTAILRVEQLYPMPVDELKAALGQLPQRRRLRLGAGGAGQPGRLVVRRAQPPGAPRGRPPAPDLASGRGGAGGRFDPAARGRAGRAHRGRAAPAGLMYFTDRGIEELVERRGGETVSLEWVAERLRDFLDDNPEFETPLERFATWLARLDDDADE